MEQNPEIKILENKAEIKAIRPQTKHLIPVKPGEVRNPKGRGKGVRDYATIYREALLILAKKNNSTPEQLEAEMIANGAILARKGNYAFYKDILDRTHGTATIKTDVTSGGKPISILNGIRNDISTNIGS